MKKSSRGDFMEEQIFCEHCGREIKERLEEFYDNHFGLILCEDCAFKMSTKEILAFFGIETRVKQ